MRFTEFPSHVQLMLLAARTPLTAAEETAIGALLQTSIDWPAFVAVTTSHRLIPPVHAGLKSFVIPADVRQTFSLAVAQNDRRVIAGTLETRRIAERFAHAGLRVIALKGRALAQTLYGDARLRHAGDLDLLCMNATTPAEMLQQIALMHGLGYTLTNPTVPLTPRRLQSYHRFWKDLSFLHTASGRPLDLHWRLFNNRRHPGNRILRRLRPVTVQVFGTPIQTLPPHDQFLHIALHGVSDEWVYLKSLADVATYLRKLTPEEFEAVLKHASELGLLPQVSSAVHLARELFGTRAFHPLLCQRTHSLHVRLRKRLLDRLQAASFRPVRSRLGALDAIRFELILVPHSVREIVLRFLYRPRVWALVFLPDRFFPLYAVLGLLLPPRTRPRRARPAVDEAQ